MSIQILVENCNAGRMEMNWKRKRRVARLPRLGVVCYRAAGVGPPSWDLRRRERRLLAAPRVPAPVVLHLRRELQVPEHVLHRRPLRRLLGQAPQADLHGRPQRLVGARLAHRLVREAPAPRRALRRQRLLQLQEGSGFSSVVVLY
jgi:hypothetical protein